MILIETFVARYNNYIWYFCYYGAGKLLPRVANHVRGCWAWGVLPRECPRGIPSSSTVVTYLGNNPQLIIHVFPTSSADASGTRIVSYRCVSHSAAPRYVYIDRH